MKKSKHVPENCVDIVLVTHQRVHFLERTIKMIKERTLYPHRLIVVDSASTDGTRQFLDRQGKTGVVDKVIFLEENVGQAEAQNIGLEHVKTKYFVTTQDDLLPPLLKPCWLERLVHLMEKHDDYGSICLRIERTRRVDWDEKEDIIRNYKSMPSVFRIHRTEEILAMGEKPFGNRKHWESPECAKMVKAFKKKFGFATHIYASHIGFMAENKGYVGKYDKYYTYSKERVTQGEEKPYPLIDPKTHIPLEIQHGVDRPEHNKRLAYWKEFGLQEHRISVKPSKIKQREEIAKYCKEGEVNLDLGCGEFKCSPNALGVDIFPYDGVDIVHDISDLWMFKDNSVDTIVSSHALEHIADTKKVLREWIRVLKKGGRLVFIIPDATGKPSTICEESHRVALTKAVVEKLMDDVMKMKRERLEIISGLENKAALIYVGTK